MTSQMRLLSSANQPVLYFVKNATYAHWGVPAVHDLLRRLWRYASTPARPLEYPSLVRASSRHAGSMLLISAVLLVLSPVGAGTVFGSRVRVTYLVSARKIRCGLTGDFLDSR